MMDILNHVVSGTNRDKLARKMVGLHLKILMAKGLFWVSAALSVIVWAIRS